VTEVWAIPADQYAFDEVLGWPGADTAHYALPAQPVSRLKWPRPGLCPHPGGAGRCAGKLGDTAGGWHHVGNWRATVPSTGWSHHVNGQPGPGTGCL